MTVPCPHCAQEVSIEDAGRFACPYCGKDFEAVNEPAGPPPIPVSPPPPILAGEDKAAVEFHSWKEALQKQGAGFVCTACGMTGAPRIQGSGWAVELLWIIGCFGVVAAGFLALSESFVAGLVVGLLSLGFPLVVSALSDKGEAPKCRACRSNLVPINSPGGFKLWEKFHRKEGQG